MTMLEQEEPLNGWQHEDAELFRADISEDHYDPVNVEVAAKRARQLTNIRVPSLDRYIIPLFEIDEPNLTDQYVFYTPDRTQIRWYDPEAGFSGSNRSASCETLRMTEIAQRLRFWLPKYTKEPELPIDDSKLPPEWIQPIDQLTDDEQATLFQNLRKTVRSEQKREWESNWETYSKMGLDEAIRRNRVTSPFLHIQSTSEKDGDDAYTFQIAVEDDEEYSVDLRKDEDLYSDTLYIADTKANDEQFPLKIEVISVDDPNITIQPDWNSVENRTVVEQILTSDEVQLRFYKLLNPVPYKRRIEAINEVKKNEQKRTLLTGQRPVEFNVDKYSIPESAIELNDYQYQALLWADSASHVVCIHGPPGTGKTRTLTSYVQQSIAKNKSVLVTAHSNQAVDNLLVGDSTPGNPEDGTLHAMAQDPDMDLSIARVGSNTQNEVVAANYLAKSSSTATVVAATTSGAAQFSQNEFDVAVVDEATQVSRPATAIVLNCAQKLVLAGDHKQLPPFSAAEPKENDLQTSLFEYLLHRYDDEISVLLRTQYRMNENIVSFPDQAFYDSNLETADKYRNWTINDLEPIWGIDIQGEEQQESYGNSLYNDMEAQAAAKQVSILVESGLEPENIGVVAAYSGQIKKINRYIGQINADDLGDVDVNTVDSFQGSEREAIIVSFVRSNDDGNSGFLEFAEEGPRRLNVALTRARKRLVLIGNWETLGTVAPHRTPKESCAHLYADLANQLRAQGRMLSR